MRVIAFVGLLLGFIAAAEITVRAAASDLKEPLLWPAWEQQNKIAAMDVLSRTGGSPIVLVGGSTVDDGFDPAQLRAMLHTKRPIFDAGLQGADMRVVDMWTRNVVVPRLHPKVIVIGMNSVQFNDNWKSQRTLYARTLESATGRQMAGTATVLDRITNWFNNTSYLVRYRSVLRNPWTAFGRSGGQRGQAVTPTGLFVHGDPIRPYGTDLLGFPDFWAGAFANYGVGGVQFQALDRLVRSLTAQHIKVAIVRMPTTSDFPSFFPHKDQDVATYDAVLRRFVATHDVQLFDAQSAIPGDHALFADPIHLKATGRARLTEFVGRSLQALLKTA